MRRPVEFVAVLMSLVATSGCLLGPKSCTLIGCTGFVVEVTGAPAMTLVTVVVTTPDGPEKSATCTGASGACLVRFYDFTPATVTIRVTAGAQAVEVTTQPAYEVTRPNGQDCPPECRNARVTVTL